MLDMPRQSRAKLVSPKMEPETKQVLETLEEPSVPEQKEESILTEVDNEIECPRCDDIMELSSSFDKLVYTCENCSIILRCV